MENKLGLFSYKASALSIKNDTDMCNNISENFGIVLSCEQMQMLDSDRRKSLFDTGRVEFGEGVIKKLVYAFCDSPYVTNNNFSNVLSAMQSAFYYLKNETEDSLSDDELIGAMQSLFNGYANGCIEKITDLTAEQIILMSKPNAFIGVDTENEGENTDAE